MDLVQTVRKEGSRGGRGEFKWSDVQSSSHREHYLGHSLMAPVGRWQQGRDLNWYAKADEDGEGAAEKAARERKEEIRKVKEAEQDALARALGFEVAPKNPNLEALGDRKEIDKILKESADDNAEEATTGVGFGGMGGHGPKAREMGDRLEGNAEAQDAELTGALREYRRRHGETKSRRRSRSLSQSRERRHHHHHRSRKSHGDDHHRRVSNRSKSPERRERQSRRTYARSRSRSPERRHRRRRSMSPKREDFRPRESDSRRDHSRRDRH